MSRRGHASRGPPTWAALLSGRGRISTIVARFVDTNVLVYAEDAYAGPKHEIARALILDLWEVGDGALGVQVLQELFVTVTR